MDSSDVVFSSDAHRPAAKEILDLIGYDVTADDNGFDAEHSIAIYLSDHYPVIDVKAIREKVEAIRDAATDRAMDALHGVGYTTEQVNDVAMKDGNYRLATEILALLDGGE